MENGPRAFINRTREATARGDNHAPGLGTRPRGFRATRTRSGAGGESGREEWRCDGCGALLGTYRAGRLYVRFARGHQYVVGFPAVSTCRMCGLTNEKPDGRRSEPPPGT